MEKILSFLMQFYDYCKQKVNIQIHKFQIIQGHLNLNKVQYP